MHQNTLESNIDVSIIRPLTKNIEACVKYKKQIVLNSAFNFD